MESKPLEITQNQVPKNGSELVLNNAEIEQLAKFLDALLESDLANKSDGGNGND